MFVGGRQVGKSNLKRVNHSAYMVPCFLLSVITLPWGREVRG